MPYYLNLAPNYDATLTPRIMTKRGFQLGGQFRYLLDRRLGRRGGGIPAARPRSTGTDRYLLSWKHNQSFDPYVKGLSGYVQLEQGIGRHVLLRSCPTASRSLSLDHAAARRRALLHERPWGVIARAQAFQTLQDPTCAAAAAVQPRAAAAGDARGNRLDGAHVVGHRRIRVFPPADADDGAARLCVADCRHLAQQGAAWYVNARTGVHVREYDLNEIRPDVPSRQSYAIPITSVDAGLVFERDVHEFGLTGIQTLEPRAVLRLRPIPQPEQRADVRHRDRRLQLRAAVLASTAISATIASVTPTSFRSR